MILAPALLAGCAQDDSKITAIGGSIGQEVKRTSCPAVGVPAHAGNITLFNPPESREARAIDVVADITDVVGHCDDDEDNGKRRPDLAREKPTLTSAITFRVDARRSDPHGDRDVVFPYFAAVLHGGDHVTSKSVSRIVVHFRDGELLASATGQASGTVSRAEATLPENIRDRLIRKRTAEDADAAVDPMTDPTIRAALAKASFELLVGFQLTQEQLAYNATR